MKKKKIQVELSLKIFSCSVQCETNAFHTIEKQRKVKTRSFFFSFFSFSRAHRLTFISVSSPSFGLLVFQFSGGAVFFPRPSGICSAAHFLSRLAKGPADDNLCSFLHVRSSFLQDLLSRFTSHLLF